MEIKITNQNPSKSVLVENALKWKLFNEKIIAIILFQLLLGIVLVIVGVSGTQILFHNTNILPSFGIAFVLLAGMYFYQNQRYKKIFFEKTRKYAEYLKAQDAEIHITITNEMVTYEDSLLSQKIQWRLFTHYKLYHNYLFLIINEKNLSSIVIDKTMLNESEFSTLFKFLNQRLIEKK
ncbi:MAG: hypothetical protein PF448_06880 [Bacteroidales bacterium]|jgi:hypothetical protein|nr:hypothetical protein [Bacteroidales bacterium]